jgi:hypothetical protein
MVPIAAISAEITVLPPPAHGMRENEDWRYYFAFIVD